MITAGSAAHASYRGATGADIGLSKWLLLRATDSLDLLVDSLNTFQPDLILGYPSIVTLLAAEQLAGRLHIHPRLVSTAGEVRTEDMELHIRKAWGIVPFQGYGMTEAFYVACDDTFHHGMHVFEDLLILEVVDDQNRPVPDGQSGAKVLVTNLYNFAQPLIRYEVPDLVTMATKPCPCGRPYRLVAKVEGRSDDILYLRNEHGQDVPIHPLHVRSAMARFEEVNEYQVIHNADGIHLRVVLREGASAEKVAIQLKAKLRGALESVRVRCPEVHIEFMDRIQRDLRQMGKLKLVLSTLPRPGA